MKSKRVISLLLCAIMLSNVVTGCGKKNTFSLSDLENQKKEQAEEEEVAADNAGANNGNASGTVSYLERPSLVGDFEAGAYDASLVPSVPSYSVDGNFSNVINYYEIEECKDEFKQMLRDNLFVVSGESGREFFDVYEMNVYSQTPNFVTVDSLMHTYHIYFAYLLKNTEKSYLSNALKTLSAQMYDKSLEQYEECKGTDWEEAAIRNVEYFGVASTLIGNSVSVPDYAKSTVDAEVSKVMNAPGIDDSLIISVQEDYSQYKPRGYYDSDELLKQYFRTMMWYGRITFAAREESELRSAALITLGLNELGTEGDGLENWKSIYAVTSFFAGASDDMGYCEYYPAIESAFGGGAGLSDIIKSDDGWNSFAILCSEMEAPKIQSIPVNEDEENVIPGFRFMGQRFTIDGTIMQNLMFRSVEAASDGSQRMLPTVLDVPAALGSKVAEEIVLEEGSSKYPNYLDRLEELRSYLKSAPDTLWTASLYSQWLDTLRPLLTEKGEGYPSFMQNREWTKKTLETFAGSYTELKHDTVLYAKQPMAEMGGGDMEIDDRGYVEPEPLVYAKFANLAKATSDGLQKFGMISSEDVENLDRLVELANKLLVISQKELKNEVCTTEEYDLIRSYGGNIEHFWYEAMKSESEQEYFTSEEFPAALVVDVATDPNGQVLEAGTGNPREIYVIVPVDGTLRVATGSVYNFYEFSWTLSDRLTDSKWREMIGAMPGEGYEYHRDDSMVNPDWTMSYRCDRWDPYEW